MDKVRSYAVFNYYWRHSRSSATDPLNKSGTCRFLLCVHCPLLELTKIDKHDSQQSTSSYRSPADRLKGKSDDFPSELTSTYEIAFSKVWQTRASTRPPQTALAESL